MRRKSVPIASASSKSGPTMTRDTHKGQTWTAGPETRQGQTHAVRPERAVTDFVRWSHRYAEARQDHCIHLQDAEIEVDSVYISERSGGTDDKNRTLRPVYGRSNRDKDGVSIMKR
jgi:hypothetical protein